MDFDKEIMEATMALNRLSVISDCAARMRDVDLRNDVIAAQALVSKKLEALKRDQAAWQLKLDKEFVAKIKREYGGE